MLKGLAGVAPLVGGWDDFPFKSCVLKISEEPHFRLQVVMSQFLSDARSCGAGVGPTDSCKLFCVCFGNQP